MNTSYPTFVLIILIVSIIVITTPGSSVSEIIKPGESTLQTKKANASILERFDFSNMEDFEDATRGFIGKMKEPVIRNAKGRPVWDLNQYKFLDREKS